MIFQPFKLKKSEQALLRTSRKVKCSSAFLYGVAYSKKAQDHSCAFIAGESFGG
jgi:hypothetical protein